MSFYDSSSLTKRMANKAIADGFISRNTFCTPQSGVFDSSIILDVVRGQMKNINKCNGGFEVDNGCPCVPPPSTTPITTTPITTTLIPPTPQQRGANAQWATYLDSSGSDIGYSIITDNDGNIYVTGQYTSIVPIFLKNANGNGQIDSPITLPDVSGSAMFLIKYNTLGIVQWATYFDSTSPDIGYSVTTDNNGYLYITGIYNSTATIFLKDASGNTQKNSQITLPVTSGNATFLINYNTSGIAQWATYFDGVGTLATSAFYITYKNSNIYITGFYTSLSNISLNDVSGNTQKSSLITLPVALNDMFLMKYNTSGVAQWATYFDSSNINIGRSIYIDDYNIIYITGAFNSVSTVQLKDVSGTTQTNSPIILPATSAGGAMFLIKYNTSGIAQWATYLEGGSSGLSLYINNNYIYITGTFNSVSTVQFKDVSGISQTNSLITLPATSPGGAMFLIKYNTSGIAQWATYLEGLNSNTGYSVIVNNNYIYIAGTYRSTTVRTLKDVSGIGQTNSSITLPATSLGAMCLIKFNTSGIAQWATYINGTGDDIGYSVTTYNNAIYVTGQYNSSTEVTIQDAVENSQIPSQIKLPATSGLAMFLIKYIDQ
jgi:hypothetical protein